VSLQVPPFTAWNERLRARRKRPRRRAAEQRDELAPLHVAPLPWQLAQQLLRNAYDVVFTVM
jgi:hypothetical protein